MKIFKISHCCVNYSHCHGFYGDRTGYCTGLAAGQVCIYMGKYQYRLTGMHQDRGSETAACGDCGCTGVGEINVCSDAFESALQVFYSVSDPGGT